MRSCKATGSRIRLILLYENPASRALCQRISLYYCGMYDHFRLGLCIFVYLSIPIHSVASDLSIWDAAAAGDTEVLQHDLDRVSLDSLDPYEGKTPLMHAASNHQVETVRWLIDQGASLSMLSRTGMSGLFYAARAGDAEIVSLLIANGCDPNLYSGEGHPPLLGAVRSGDLASFQALLEHGADPSGGSMAGWAPLHQAASQNQTEMIEILHEAGADCNALVEDGTSPLAIAARKASTEAAVLLLEMGADFTILSRAGTSVLSYASRGGSIEIVRILLDLGCDPNRFTGSGHPSLSHAAFFGHLDVMQILLVHHADPDGASAFGVTAMHNAANVNQSDAVRALAAAGANLSPRTRDGATPLVYAARNGHQESVDTLLEIGADGGDSQALWYALGNKYFSVALSLINGGADLRGNTVDAAPLWQAARHGNDEVVERLIELGAPVPVFHSGLFEAVIGGHSACVELLTAHGARISPEQWEEAVDAARNNSDVRSHIAIVRANSPVSENPAENIQHQSQLDAAAKLMLAAHQGQIDNIPIVINRVLRENPWAIDAAEQYARQEGRIDVVASLSATVQEARARAGRAGADLVALTRAVRNGNTGTVQALLERGADPNYGDANEDSPIQLAIDRNDADTIRLLLDFGHDPDRDPGWQDRSPLAQAVYRSTPKIISILLAAGADPSHGGDSTTPLYFAASQGNTDLIQLLADAGADLDARIGLVSGATALMVAAKEGHVEAVVLLATLGASLELEDNRGRTAMELADANAQKEAALALAGLGAESTDSAEARTPQLSQRAIGDPEQLRRLLEAGADPNARVSIPQRGRLLPIEVVLRQVRVNRESAGLLFEFGATLDGVVGELARLTDLHVGEGGLLQLLIEMGADLDESAPGYRGGATPIQLAAATHNFELFEALLAAGADPMLNSEFGRDIYSVIRSYPHQNEPRGQIAVDYVESSLQRWAAERAERD